MSTVKTYRKGIVSRGELVFDQNLNPLQSKKASKNISLKSYLASALPKTLEHADTQTSQAFFDNVSHQSRYFSGLGSPQFQSQLYAPSRYANAYQGPKAAGKEGVCDPSISGARHFGQSVNNPIIIPEDLEALQGDLSEAMDMDTSSDMEDDLSENMDLSSGPEVEELSDEQSMIERVGSAPLRAVVIGSEPDVEDDFDKMVTGKENDNTSSKVMESSFVLAVHGRSDTASTTPRMSSTPSGNSRPSSHTSAGPSHLKDSTEDPSTSFDMLQAPSRSSSLSSRFSPAISATPPIAERQSSALKVTRRNPPKPKNLRFSDLRPRTSLPANLAPTVIAQQGIHAAYSSRLNPFALHPDEYQLLRNHICHLHVTAYLNIRNRILRLWVRNPLVSVTAEEAAGCALGSRWLGLAEVAYEWLARKGYINFGCVEAPDTSDAYVKRYKSKRYRRKTIVVVGAGMSGLGCARQLEGLFEHYREKWTSIGEEPPRVIILEGRNRIGGRIYSHPLKNQKTSGIPDQNRSTAEMGAHIIIGFDHGNPLSMIVRGQLALHYYALKDNSTLHDTDGQVVDGERDSMVEKLYNDVLDRASVYRHRVPPLRTVEGDKELIEAGRDPQREGSSPISVTEQDEPSDPTATSESVMIENVPGGIDKLTGRAHMVTGSRKKEPPALTAEKLGWKIASSVLSYRDLNLDVVAKASEHPTLGAAMDEAVKQYQFLLDLSALDLRLLNWHYANLEYANAANVGKLSLGGWDQDTGNEFEGVHAQVIGGYQQVPWGVLHSPHKLDLRTRKVVKRISYSMDSSAASTIGKVSCEDGEVFEADHIVLTTPLGVLKDETITFDPPLPSWKTGPIQRLGFGTLNKVILVFDAPFWNVDQDMFGLLREPEVHDSLDQEDYIANRGRFYFFWNCIKTTGRPVLISLLAGDAAHQAESASDAELVAEVTHELAKIFELAKVPEPLETIVTRWGKDRFARGSYSYVGATSMPGDYEAMAAPVGTLHFSGEATCATHPATVHGAYISGLRAASEVIDDLIGPIEIPNPLVSWPAHSEVEMTERPQKPKADHSAERLTKHTAEVPPPEADHESAEAKQARLEAFESEILGAIKAELGLRPSPPGKPGSNPFLLFTTDKWAEVKKACDDARIAATGNPEAKAPRDVVRAAVGQLWRAAPEEKKRPYFEQTSNNRRVNQEEAATYEARLESWDSRAMEVRREYVRQHPGVLTEEEEANMWRALGVQGDYGNYSEERRAKKMSGYAEDSDSGADV